MKKEDWMAVAQLPEEIIHDGKGIGCSHHVLVTDRGTIWVACYLFNEDGKDNGEWMLAHGKDDLEMKGRKPTHWMPLPEIPE